MQGSRTEAKRWRPRIVLDKSFLVSKNLQVGDKGQMLITGIIESERIEELNESDIIVKTIKLQNAEILTNKNARQYT